MTRFTSISRREALLLAGATLVTASLSGCGASGAVARVIVQLPWATILRAGTAVITSTNLVLTVAVTLAEGIRMLEARLRKPELTSLADGGRLILRTRSGQEIEVPYTVR